MANKVIGSFPAVTDSVGTDVMHLSRAGVDKSITVENLLKDVIAGSFAPLNEIKTLADGQVIVAFATLTTEAAVFYISGADADRGILVETDDYIVDSTTQITLTESYPVGTKVILTKNGVA